MEERGTEAQGARAPRGGVWRGCALPEKVVNIIQIRTF